MNRAVGMSNLNKDGGAGRGKAALQGAAAKGRIVSALTLLMVLTFVLLSSSPAYAGWTLWGGKKDGAAKKGDLLKKEKSLEDVKRQIREEKENIREISRKETGVLGELERIDRLLSSKREDIARIENSLDKLKKEMNYSAFRISRLEAEKKTLGGRLEGRLRAMYRMRNEKVLNVLFSEDLSEEADIGRKTKYLTLLMERDRALIDAVRDTIERLSEERKRHEALKERLEGEKAEAATGKREAEDLKKEKHGLLEGTRTEKENSEKIIKELEDAAVELSTLIRRLKEEKGEESVEPGAFASMKGSLPMPVEGSVVSRYGKVKHPKFNTVTFNNGITIEARAGSPVRSVHDGRVVYAGWLKGYGQIMILEHGGGFYTLYARLEKVLKGKGDFAAKGEDIALVGDSGPQASPGLYFEIRERGVPKDPLSWLASR